jgi:predicted peptidase
MSWLSCLMIMALVVVALPVAAVEVWAVQTHRAADGTVLPYRLLTPEPAEAGKRYPLVVFLHGAGERGDDNRRQLTHGAPAFATPQARAQFPCFVIAPQCPAGRRWCEVDWGAEESHRTPPQPSVPLAALLEVIELFRQRPDVDQARLYVTGLSMGGFGTWDLITRRPTLFAAAVPVCGGGDVQAAPHLVSMPVWIFHGAKDTVVKTVRSRQMHEAIRQAGGKLVRYSEYPGVGHDAWTRAYQEPELLTWLFAQRRG